MATRGPSPPAPPPGVKCLEATSFQPSTSLWAHRGRWWASGTAWGGLRFSLPHCRGLDRFESSSSSNPSCWTPQARPPPVTCQATCHRQQKGVRRGGATWGMRNLTSDRAAPSKTSPSRAWMQWYAAAYAFQTTAWGPNSSAIQSLNQTCISGRARGGGGPLVGGSPEAQHADTHRRWGDVSPGAPPLALSSPLLPDPGIYVLGAGGGWAL
mmetsp:Transcript_2626/g.6663  ORF Transcript_2626/g.6663 Transcript_2626/m.6663 type:complete len:211 (-) Transcript_2626:89-721(-)